MLAVAVVVVGGLTATPAHAAADDPDDVPIVETDDAPQNNLDAEQSGGPEGEPVLDPVGDENPSGPQQAPARAPGCGSATVAAVTASGAVTKWSTAQSPSGQLSTASTVGAAPTLASATTMALDDDNALFAVGSDGTLRRYPLTDGAYSSGESLGTGFSSTKKLLSAGYGILYTIATDGTLRWYRYGSEDWAWDPAGRVVGSGWAGFKTVFSGGDGILYAVTTGGDLLWYRHGEPGLGEGGWEGPEKVGTGWDDFTQITGVGEGVIYGLLPNGTLKYYQHLGYEDGTNSWETGHGTVVGTGLSTYTRLTTTPNACIAAAKAPRPPKRGNSTRRMIYLVHGFGLDRSSFDCKDYWGTFIKRFKDKGWRGDLRTVKLYEGDTNCDVSAAAKGNRNTDIETLGLGLARLINRRHPTNSVDVIGHSMGGLVARYAIQGVAQGLSGWPRFVNVEDAVTLATPNQGTNCPVPVQIFNQCRQMDPGSAFMRKLKPNPQAATKTDWTTISHSDDIVVNWWSGTGAIKERDGYLGPGHFIYYYSRNYGHRTAHMDLLWNPGVNSFRALHADYHHKRLSTNRDSAGHVLIRVTENSKYPWGRRYNRAPDPIEWAYNAVYSWDTW